MPLSLQDIQASELAHAELEESAAARHRQCEDDQQRATAARKEKEVLEAAVAAAERRLMALQQQAQVRPATAVMLGSVGFRVHLGLGLGFREIGLNPTP
jgi:hypothetical protein